MRELLKD